MEETAMPENQEPGKLSVSFERKVDLGNYQNCTASAFLTLPVDPNLDLPSQFGDAFSQVKAAIFDELGIEVLMDSAGVIREKHNPTVTTRVENALGREFGATPAGGSGGGFDKKGLEVSGDMTQDIPDWLVEICQANGVDHVWANTGQYGQFYKEFVSKGGTAKMGVDSQGRTVIISKPK
jgi:hypothetical protein